MKIIIAIVSFLVTLTVQAQIKNAKIEIVNVSGNCGMCQRLIEKTGTIKNIVKTDWDVETKQATITYNTKKTNIDDILKRVAAVGYDNDKYTAPDEAYNKLHSCCRYTRVAKKEQPLKDTDNSNVPLDSEGLPKRPLPPVYNNQQKEKPAGEVANGVSKADAIPAGRPVQNEDTSAEQIGQTEVVSDITLQASGLTCSMCNLSIKKSLEALPFVSSVEANIENAVYHIKVPKDKQVDFSSLQKAVKKAGFSVADLSFNIDMDAIVVTNKTITAFELYGQKFKLPAGEQLLSGIHRFRIVDKNFLTEKNYKRTKEKLKFESQLGIFNIVKL
jgi:copper chaperone CopZ